MYFRIRLSNPLSDGGDFLFSDDVFPLPACPGVPDRDAAAGERRADVEVPATTVPPGHSEHRERGGKREPNTAIQWSYSVGYATEKYCNEKCKWVFFYWTC